MKPRSVSVNYATASTRIRVPLDDSRDPEAMGRAIMLLNAVASDPKRLRKPEDEYEHYLVTTFHTPNKKWLRERRFFARCAKHEALHPLMLEYVKRLTTATRALDKELCHGDCHPAGCFAIVPLALRDPKFIDPLIEHFRGWDMDHESFHPSLIEELLQRHGIGPETLRLLAWRAIESDGQRGANLTHAVRDHALLDKLEQVGGIEGFAALCWAINKREKYLPLYVSSAGESLFAGDPAGFAKWISLFEARGLTFDESERKGPKESHGTHRVLAWPDDFEDDENG